MPLYADTSFLASIYLPDANSAKAQAIVRGLTAPLPFTALHRLELHNAIELSVFRGRVTAAQVPQLHRALATDLRMGRLQPEHATWYPVFRVAANLARTHTAATGTRSLDVLHVALAWKLGAVEFFSFDLRQKTLAIAAGLTVRP